MNWNALKIEISLPAYSGMDDAAIAATINAKTVTVDGDYYASARALYAVLGMTKGKAVMDAIAEQDQTLYAMMTQVGKTDGYGGGIDVTLPETHAFIDRLIAGNVLNRDDKNALIGLATKVTSWRVEALGQVEPVSADQIAFARSLEVAGG